jgi:hypothetical protein
MVTFVVAVPVKEGMETGVGMATSGIADQGCGRFSGAPKV